MTDVPENFDWVTVRTECSANILFEALRLQIENDIRIRNESLRSGQRQKSYQFVMVRNNGMFAVVVDGLVSSQHSVQFTLSDGEISVSDVNGDVLLEATPTISDDGKCRLKVNGQDRELWQVRKDALEELLFGAY